MNRFKRYFVVFICCIFLSLFSTVNAQTDPPPPNPWGDCVPDPFQECPIDGGIGLLIAAGVALGARNRAAHKK